LGFSQIIATLPLRRITLHFSQIFLTEALTFIFRFSIASSKQNYLSNAASMPVAEEIICSDLIHFLNQIGHQLANP
jgi:hypothetical protein